MFGGLERQFAVRPEAGRTNVPRTLVAPPECATLSGVTVGGDGCPTNGKLFGHILAKVASEWLPSDDAVQVAVASTCLQHGVALCKSHIAGLLDINVPIFCISKQFAMSGHSQAAEAGAYHFIDSRLDWIQASEQPDWRPNAEHIEYARDVIRVCSANRHFNRRRQRRRRGRQFRQEPVDEEEVDFDLVKSQWLRHCEELLAECPGNWTAGRPLHWCRGCCLSREEAVAKVYGLVMLVMFSAYISVPSENKWLSLVPATQQVCLLLCWHGLLAYIEHFIHAGGSESARKHHVLPPDYGITCDWEATRSAYNRRAARFIHDPCSGGKLLFYLAAIEPLMTLHYKFFKHGTRHIDSGFVDMDDAGLVFDICQVERSPVVPAFARISSFILKPLFDASVRHFWRPIFFNIGEVPDALWWTMRGALLATLGAIRRKLWHLFENLPFGDLVAAFDPRNSDAVADKAAERIHGLKSCCLDPACTAKLRRRFGRVSRRVSKNLSRFMVALFGRVQLCSSSIECDFAAIRQWLGRSNRPLSMAVLAAKDMNNKVSRDSCFGDDNERSRLPLWARKTGNVNGLHLFMRSEMRRSRGESFRQFLSRGREAWRVKAKTKKVAWRVKAKTHNRHQQALRSVAMTGAKGALRGSTGRGYLGLGDGTFPLSEEFLLSAGYQTPKVGLVKSKASEWELVGNRVKPSKTFGSGLSLPKQPCGNGICFTALPAGRLGRLKCIRWSLEAATLFFAPQAQNKQPVLLPQFVSGAASEAWLCSGFCKRRPGFPFSGEYIKLLDLGYGLDDAPRELCTASETIANHVCVVCVVNEVLERQLLDRDASDPLIGFDFLACRTVFVVVCVLLSRLSRFWFGFYCSVSVRLVSGSGSGSGSGSIVSGSGSGLQQKTCMQTRNKTKQELQLYYT